MKGKGYIYKVDGKVEVREYEAAPSLEGLREVVGGYIETVPHWKKHKGEPCVAFCNEEGKLHKLPLNIKATVMWMKSGAPLYVSDVLVGDVIVLQGDDEFMEAI